MTEILKTVEIDTEKGIYKINGEDIGNDTSKLKLEFENGEWTLEVTREFCFVSCQQKAGWEVEQIWKR